MAPTTADPAARYWEVTLTLGEAPETGEVVANRLWEAGAVGVVEEAGEPGGTTLRAFFPPGTDAAALAAELARYLADLALLDLPGVDGRVAVAPLPDAPWAEAWRVHFRPVAVGRRLLVCPPWEAPRGELAGTRLVVVIEPGRAFGTGGHGSTRGCLELLERALEARPVPRVLDVGCGSGVLGIAAARLGVAQVDAIDLDPDAVTATEENARRNEVSERVRGSVASLTAWEGPAAPLVVANLLAAAHVTLAPTLAVAVAPGGRLIAGGLLPHEVPAVAGALAAEGCHLVEVTEHEGWTTLLLERGA